MPDSKISALPSATVPLAGTEVLPIVQSSVTDKVTAADLLRQNGQTVTTSNPVLSLAQTWNAGAVTFTGLLFNATNTASASQSLLLDLQVGGTSQFKVNKSGAGTFTEGVSAGTYLRVNGTNSGYLAFGTADDVILQRDGAANTLAQRNSTNAQTFRVYNTYTDASNYERGVFDWSTAANALTIGTQKAGTGATRVINFSVGNAQRVQFGAASATLDVGLIFGADNTYDIGASGATRPRYIYAANNVVTGGSFIGSSAGTLTYGARTTITSPADGVLLLQNNALADFTRLQFGGTTSSFPALGRSGAVLRVRLADDSASGNFACGNLQVAASNATGAGGTTGLGIQFGTTANFGVFFGSGAPTLSAAKGSLYLRSDGSGTGDRMYVNTDSSTTWTAVTTAA